MTDLVDWKGKKGQQGTILLSSRLFRRVNCGFQVEKKTRIGTEFDKKPINFQFSKILCNCCQNFDRLRGLEC